MRSPRTPTMRAGGRQLRLPPLGLDRVVAGRGSEEHEHPDRLIAEEDRPQPDPPGLAAELGHHLRRARPAVVEAGLLDAVADEAREVHARLPADRGVERRHARRDAEEQARLLVGDHDLAAGVEGGDRLPGSRSRLGERRGQFGTAVVGALTQARARVADRSGEPAGGLLRKLGAPRRDVEHRHGITRHRVANGDAGAHPFVESRAPVLRAADQHRPGRLERRAHPVGARRPLRPARPRRHVARARACERVLVALDGEDATRGVGDGDDAAHALHLAGDRRRGAAELGEHDFVLERLHRRGLVLGGCGRGDGQTRVDVILLATSVPRRRHLGPDPTHAVVPGEEPLARRRDRFVSLCVGDAVATCGLAHA